MSNNKLVTKIQNAIGFMDGYLQDSIDSSNVGAELAFKKAENVSVSLSPDAGFSNCNKNLVGSSIMTVDLNAPNLLWKREKVAVYRPNDPKY